MSDSSNNENQTLDRTTWISAILLAIPPLAALIAGFFPHSVPIPFVEVTEPESMRPVFFTLGFGLLIINAAFLFLVRRMLGRD